MRRSAAPSQRGRGPPPPVNQVKVQHRVHDEEQTRRFEVLYGRISTKTTQKTFEKDGILELKRNENVLNLYDEEGDLECSDLYMSYMKLKEGAEFIVDSKEVKIIRELPQNENHTESPEPPEDNDDVDVVLADYKTPRQEEPRQIKQEQTDSDVAVKTEVLGRSQPNLAAFKESRASPGTINKIQTQPDEPPHQWQAREELVLFCHVSHRQKIVFQGIYRELEKLPDNADPMELLTELQECCCDLTSGKIPVIDFIVEKAIGRQESVLILADSEKILNALLEFVQQYKTPSWLLLEETDVEDLISVKEKSKILIASVGLLGALRRHRIVLHRTIINECVTMDEEATQLLFEVTLRSVYELLICGSIEEQLFQMKHGLMKNDDVALQCLRSPLNYSHPETHNLLNCQCLEDEDQSEDRLSVLERLDRKRQRLEAMDLRDNWDHLTGPNILAQDKDHDHLKVIVLLYPL